MLTLPNFGHLERPRAKERVDPSRIAPGFGVYPLAIRPIPRRPSPPGRVVPPLQGIRLSPDADRSSTSRVGAVWPPSPQPCTGSARDLRRSLALPVHGCGEGGQTAPTREVEDLSASGDSRIPCSGG